MSEAGASLAWRRRGTDKANPSRQFSGSRRPERRILKHLENCLGLFLSILIPACVAEGKRRGRIGGISTIHPLMRWSALFVLTFYALASEGRGLLYAAEVSEQRKSELLLALGHNRFERVDNLPREEKEWLLDYIRKKREEPTWAGTYELQLIQLGDEEAMKRCLEVFDQYPDASHLLSISRQPLLIEHMAPTMFHDEPWAITQWQSHTIVPRSVSAAGLVAIVLSTSHEISGPVRQWAAEINRAAAECPDLAGRMRSSMRQWWKDNEGAMRAHNWAAVKPGMSIVGAGAPATPPSAMPSSAPSSRPDGNESEGGSHSASKMPVGPKASSSSGSFYIVIILVASVALIFGLRFARK